VLTDEKLQALQKILPVPDEEISMLKGYDGDFNQLGDAEKFVVQLLEVRAYLYTCMLSTASIHELIDSALINNKECYSRRENSQFSMAVGINLENTFTSLGRCPTTNSVLRVCCSASNSRA
jgi:hypothetical protein